MTQARSAQLPAPSGPPAAQSATSVTTGVLTARDVAALQARASVLSHQLISATGRRTSVQHALRNAIGADKAGLEQRLGVLDSRIARLESDIDENGSQLASLSANKIASTQPPFPGFNNSLRNRAMDNLVPMVIVFTIFVLAPIAISIARMFWKRGTLPTQAPQSAESAQRLERMEHAIDSIAIEIERVSEGQRFVTRLMSERQNAVLGAGQQPERPISVPVGEKIGVPR
jgi:hypothetical protein